MTDEEYLQALDELVNSPRLSLEDFLKCVQTGIDRPNTIVMSPSQWKRYKKMLDANNW